MGKKRIIQKTESESLEEKKEETEIAIKKELIKEIPHKTKEGKIYISSSYNNTIIVLTDLKGNVLVQVSAGSLGFKGTKKSTPFAASKVAEALVLAAKKLGVETVQILIKGIGSGRDSAMRSLMSHGLEIISIKDITPIPHNGCRPVKVRRV